MTSDIISRVAHPDYTVHRIDRGAGSIHVREYPGEGPAFVALHGFPDNLHIFDDLVPLLVSCFRSPPVQVWSTVRSLAWSNPAPEIERWQGAPGPDHSDGR